MKELIINAQWQGGADFATFDGANELIQMYLDGQNFVNLPVSTDLAEMAVKKNAIKGFDVLHRQMQSAYGCLLNKSPDKIFALGGGCDADVPIIVYLSEKYREDLTVLWLDAHGDLNTPSESTSSLFYGMPLRSLMNGTCFGLLENRFPLTTSQIIHIGGRDFDDAEKTFIKESGISVFTVQNLRSDGGLIERMVGKLQSKSIYIHLDLDVIDPADFPQTPLPVDEGLYCKETFDILNAFASNMVGLGVYEYVSSGVRNAFVEQLIQFGLYF